MEVEAQAGQKAKLPLVVVSGEGPIHLGKSWLQQAEVGLAKYPVLVEPDGYLVSPATLISRRRKRSIVIQVTMMRKCPERRNFVLSFT